MRQPLVLLGEGALFSAILQELELQGYPIEIRKFTDDELCHERVIISAYDWWDPKRDLALQRRLRAHCVAWLPLWIDFTTLWAGPWIFPHEAGCLHCLDERRLRLDIYGAHRQALQAHIVRARAWLQSYPLPLLPYLRPALALLKEDVQRIGAMYEPTQAYPPAPPRLRQHVLLWNLRDVDLQLRSLLPVSGCSECSRLPEDCPERAWIALQPRVMSHPGSWRAREALIDSSTLEKQAVDPLFGVIKHVDSQPDTLIRSVALVPVPGTGAFRLEPGIGRATKLELSRRVAMLEALERSAGFVPGGKQPALSASYREISDQALDPRRLVLFAPDQYAQPGFPFTPFDEDQRYLWVWAYSFRRQRPVAIPEECAYYGPRSLRGHGEQDPWLVREISNGCALGNCLEEAILHGIFEVLERDAFLLTWYARLTPRCLDLESVSDRQILLLKDRLWKQGYETWAFDITREFGIPTVWIMVVSRDNDPALLKTLSAAGCHIDPEMAIRSGLIEAAAFIEQAQSTYAGEREQALQLLEDSSRVREMDDHMLLYALPEAFERLRFLFEHAHKPVPLQEAFPDYPRVKRETDLTEGTRRVLNAILQQGLDVLVFDQTTQEQQQLGLRTVRVLIPGTLPMSFGYDTRRCTGCERLDKLIQSKKRADSLVEINPWPHPFP